jgi:hypothetical protein
MTTKKKNRRTIEVIESTKHPEIEHRFIKYPGEEAVDITHESSSGERIAKVDPYLEVDLLDEHYGKKYTSIHTHPSALRKGKEYVETDYSATPSALDMKLFLENNVAKADTIAVREPQTGKVRGYIVVRKTKNTPQPGDSIWEVIKLNLGLGFAWRVRKDAAEYKATKAKYLKEHNFKLVNEAFNNLAHKYHLQYKFLPAADYHINESRTQFVRKKGIEEKVLAGLFILFGATFLTGGITGGVIGALSSSSLNFLGALFFVTGLCLLFISMKER